MKSTSLLAIIFSLLIFCSCNSKREKINETQKDQDSIQIWINQSYDNKLNHKNKLNKIGKAYNKIIVLDNDSINITQMSSIAYRFYELNDSIRFFETNLKNLKLSKKRRDTFAIGDSHWNYAEYYLKNEIYGKAYYHYNQAYNEFLKVNKEYEIARMLYAMAFIKGRFHDYSGSEVLTFKAIETFKNNNNYQYLFLAYNNLASTQNDIKNYDQALVYHDKALTFLNQLKNKKNYYIWNLNNTGSTYLKKKNYSKALTYFQKALAEDPSILDKAMVLDNLSYCKLLMRDTIGIERKLFRALKIRDSLDAKVGVITSKIRLSKFFAYKRDTVKAIEFAKEANNLALEYNNGVDYLSSLEILSSLDKKKSNRYLEEHIRFNDSLTNAERKTLNKFTRIEFETDEILETNKILTQQRIYIFGGSIVLILILSLLYFIRVQKAKNEKLFLETEQQKANEQVYLLTLKQQATLEEERTKERNRISQELHDGILGRLFGTRVGLGFLDFEADEQTQEQHETFLEELQDIEKEIREVSHKLNDNFKDPDVNFTTIVTELLESKSQIGDFQFHLNIDENISWKSTDEIIKVNVYRIIQETLQNAIKHAKAKNVTLDFSTDESQLWVQIKDDGIGFNLRKSRKGIGLKNMKSRVEKLNGTLDVQSAVNKGTQIHIKIPFV